MAKKYEMNVFGERIGILQAERKYTNQKVIHYLPPDNDGNPLINDTQTYMKYKSGERFIRGAEKAVSLITAFAKLYNVTTDYLLGNSDDRNPSITNAQELTGLQYQSIQSLYELKEDNSPMAVDSLRIIDCLLKNSDYFMTFTHNLKTQLYAAYKAEHAKKGSAYDMESLNSQYIASQAIMNYLKDILFDVFKQEFSEQLDREKNYIPSLEEQQTLNEYYDSLLPPVTISVDPSEVTITKVEENE
ncbi:hypothetical protein D7X88_17010 [bacterium C-53]|nr:hypothetical protein [Lachnospiraceae bacterium]NBI04654.1 hypothetical protein [Lachnospiraceae bacterium]RKJ07956.1 hypothetical protein D7X88_17010 [bacterium C-53]